MNRLFLIALFLSACATTETQRNPVYTQPTTLHQDLVMQHFGDLKKFEIGPYTFTTDHNRVLDVTHDLHVVVDLYQPNLKNSAPLVIIQHGNHSKKEAHQNHCERLASWGFYCIAMQQQNFGHWMENGKNLNLITKMIYVNPKLIGDYVDPDKIILVGHSFGGSAVSIAIADGAPVMGAVLLDPAVVHKLVLSKLQKVRSPIFLLGADKKVFFARDRKQFGKRIPSEYFEISVRGATHDDAQNPSVHAASTYGIDPFTSNKQREVFTEALLVNTISLAATGSFVDGWKFLSSRNLRAEIKPEVARP